jgi:hypothetical protein
MKRESFARTVPAAYEERVFRPLGVALVLLSAIACSHNERRSEASQGAVALPSSPKDPWDPSGTGWKLSPGAVQGERNRCIDRELGLLDLNEFGDPMGTKYAEGRPLGVTGGTDRYDYVLRNHPSIRTTCTPILGEPR